MKKFSYLQFILLTFIVLALIVGAAEKKGKKGSVNNNSISSSQARPDAYRFEVNRLSMPINSRGIVADVQIGGSAGGQIDGKVFLFSAGFFMSGLNDQGVIWSNAMASASRTEDYVVGTIAGGEERGGLYILKSTDAPFGESWQEWKTAVEDGAYYYDGDGDGAYNPVDKNGNGIWDTDEDAPDLLGDETVWCVYNDGLPASSRNFETVEPQGIEIRQTLWGYATSGDLGNIIFLRYSILNTGTVSAVQDSVFFGVWADPDLGDFSDDLVGSDTDLDAGYVYNDGPDPEFGSDPPAFLIDFFQGPWEFTNNPEDEAYNTKGLTLGIDTIKGAVNLGLSSFIHYMQSHPTQGDPDNETQARNYLKGFNQAGNLVDPCNWQFGTVVGGVNCAEIDSKFMYSGDPVTLTGWLNSTPTDQRQMSNTGPFKLETGKPVDIVAAYVVGRSSSAIASVKDVKKIDRSAQFAFQNNFNIPSPPQTVVPTIRTEDNIIELIWETAPQMNYRSIGNGFDMLFEGYEVKMYNRNSTANVEAGSINSVVIARYDVANSIKSLIYEDPITGERTITWEEGIQLDSALYSDPVTGRIKLTITTDPFTNGPLIKGKPYFFSITSFALNRDEIQMYDAIGTYIIPGTATVGQIQTIPVILNDDMGNIGIAPGKDSNTPFYSGIVAEKASGVSTANIYYSVFDKAKAKSGDYEVSFFLDSLSTFYSLFYKVTHVPTGAIIADSVKYYDSPDITTLFDGVTLDVEWVVPGIDSVSFSGADRWFLPQDDSITGAFYVGADLETSARINVISTKSSNATSVGALKTVEVRFGELGKAYRYARDPVRYIYQGVTDPAQGFVDVPFKAYRINGDGTETQLAVAFTETKFVGDSAGVPDGKWHPYSDIGGSKEYIAVFNTPYDPTGTQVFYTGATSAGDIGNGFRLLGDDYTDEEKKIAGSPWFDALYVLGFETNADSASFNPTGTYSISPTKFLTVNDKYVYNIQVDQTEDDSRSQWEKVNVYPNPLFGYNPGTSYVPFGRYDEPFVTFTNLPQEVTIKIYTLSGSLVRTLTKNDQNPELNWDLENENGLRVASGMFLAVVNNPKLGDKVLKLAVIMPQKQIQYY